MNKELAEYLFLCVTFHHDFDESYKITPAATDKEIELYKKSIDYLKEIINEYKKEKHVVLTKEEQEFIDKVKEEKQNISSLKISKSEIVIKFKDLILNGYVVNGHTWTYPYPSFALMNEIRKML